MTAGVYVICKSCKRLIKLDKIGKELNHVCQEDHTTVGSLAGRERSTYDETAEGRNDQVQRRKTDQTQKEPFVIAVPTCQLCRQPLQMNSISERINSGTYRCVTPDCPNRWDGVSPAFYRPERMSRDS